jgi:hypothetical protein
VKRNFRRIVEVTTIGLVLAAGFFLVSPPMVSTTPAAIRAAAVSGPVPPCSISTLAGDWAFRMTGETGTGVVKSGIGTFHADKDGTVSTHGWVNVGGTMFMEFSRTGTATVDADCTGTQVWDDGGPAAKTVILENGRETWATYDQPGSATVILKRIDQAHNSRED